VRVTASASFTAYIRDSSPHTLNVDPNAPQTHTRHTSRPATNVRYKRATCVCGPGSKAHIRAEEQLFPAALARDIPVVAFTSTRWGSLETGHPQWTHHPPPTVADCVRFALHPDAVQVVLRSTHTLDRLDELVTGVATAEPMKSGGKEVEQWKEYGRLVYDAGDAYEKI